LADLPREAERYDDAGHDRTHHVDEEEKEEEEEEEFTPQRLELVTDAIMSIIATLNVLPLMELLNEAGAGFNGPDAWGLFSLYAITFFLSSMQHFAHSRMFAFTQARDSTGTTIINMIYICVFGLFPFASNWISQGVATPSVVFHGLVFTACSRFCVSLCVFVCIIDLERVPRTVLTSHSKLVNSL